MKIDAHQHFWRFNPVRDSWITKEMGVLRRNFLPSDLKKELIKNDIDGCIAVQASQSLEETECLLAIAEKHDYVKGVVGWVDLRSKKLEKQLEMYAGSRSLVGFRHIVQAEQKGYLADRSFNAGISKISENNYTYDVLIYENQLMEAIPFLKRHMNARFVIDHLAKPKYQQPMTDRWRLAMSEIALLPNVWIKLSGMMTEVKWRNWSISDFSDHFDFLLDKFSAERLMFGSDWPVCLLSGSYTQALNIVEKQVAQLSQAEQANIMGENAAEFYQLKTEAWT